jgi:Glycosyl hydrolases family 35
MADLEMARLGAQAGVFTLDGRPWLWRAGEFQYFRIRPDLWRPGLEKLKAAGFNAISSYIPWIWHEPEEGALDFSGQTHPQRNLLAFLEACRAADLPLMARPGPFIFAEYRGFGHPRWLGEQYPDTVMRGPDGRLIRGDHYYNYAVMQATYLAKVERWYAALVDVLRPYFDHPVISFQLDNETGVMYKASLGKLDFNLDTVGRYRIFLHDTYGEIEALNAAWGTGFHSFGQILPPHGKWGRGEAIDWQRFLEDWLVNYLKYLRKIAGELGVPVPLAINEQATYLSPAHPGNKSQVADLYGFDLCTKSSGSPVTADFPFLSSQAPALFSAYATPERPAACLELGAGWWGERVRIASEATIQAMLGCVAHSTRGYAMYMVHDVKDSEGAPYHLSFHTLLDEEGREQPRYEVVRGVQQFLAQHERAILQSTESSDAIAYLHYQPYSRLTIDEYVPRREVQRPLPFVASLGLVGFYDLLVSAGYQPRFFDLEQVTDEQLAAHRVAILPTKRYLDDKSLAKLRRYVEQGGQLITLPGPVRHDAYGWQLPGAEALYPYAEQSMRWLGNWRMMLGVLSRWMIRSEPALVGQAIELPGVRLTSASGAAVRGDYQLICFGPETQMPAEQIVLRAGSQVAGYRVSVGQGTSTVLGTIPGGAHATSVYYKLASEERAGLRRFAVELMDAAGVQRQVMSDLELETVRRCLPDGSWLLFLLNRLSEQHGELKLALEGLHALRVETLYHFKHSNVEVSGPASLKLLLAADDVLALRVLPG